MGLAGKTMFDKYRKDVLERKTTEPSDWKRDERLVYLKSGNTYRMRLLFFTGKETKRQEPFIEKWSHAYYEEETKASDWVTCPTTEYIKGKAGFRECPICNNNSKLWKQYEAGSPSAKELYKKFKRRFVGYALVYVIKDPINPDNNGHVKIVKYSIGMSDFLKKEILGNEEDGADPIRSAAFDINDGYDLLITVGTKDTEEGKFNSYEYKFAREKTALNVKMEDIEKEAETLNFDQSFYTQSSKEDILKFYNKWVIDQCNSDAVETKTPKVEKPKAVAENVAPKESAKVDVKTEVKTQLVSNQAVTPPVKSQDEGFDIDSILKDVDNNL